MRTERKQRHSLSSKVAEKTANRQNGRRGNSYLLLPDGVEMFRPDKEGNRRFNIVPYVAGKNNRDTKPGELDYEFTFFVHRIGDGEDQKMIVCPKKTFGKPCPICEQVEKLSKDYTENEDEIKLLRAKQRQLFNITDARDEENKILIYETSYYKGFGELLDKRLKSAEEDDDDGNDYRSFADIPGGLTLKVMYTEESFNGNKFFAPSSIDFVSRKDELPDSIIDDAVCLDSCLKVLSYEDILKLIAGTNEEEDETPSAPVKPVKYRPQRNKLAEVEKDEDDDDEEEEQEEVTEKITRKKAVKKASEDDEEEEEEKIPAKKTAKKKPVKEEYADDEEEEEPDEEEGEEEEPVKPAKKATKKAGKCPHGYAWGADCYVYSECDECELCDECDAAQEDN